MQLLAQHDESGQRGEQRQEVDENAAPVGPQALHAFDPQVRQQHRREDTCVKNERNRLHIQRRLRRRHPQIQRQHVEQRKDRLHKGGLPGRNRHLPVAQQHAIQRIGQGRQQHQAIARMNAVLEHAQHVALAHQIQEPQERQHSARGHAQGQRISQDHNAQQHAQQRNQRRQDGHVGGGGGFGRPVGQRLEHRRRQGAVQRQLGPVAQDDLAVAPGRPGREQAHQEQRQHQAVEGDGSGRDGAGGHLGHDDIARPEQDGEQGKQIGHGNFA
ncbi:hypothetical protein D3C87_1303690 [compost metagenome]